MPITFHPKPGNVLICDFKGNEVPEIVKRRPVVVISPAHLRRPGLVTVVPLSTTAPDPVAPYHYLLTGNPVPGEGAKEVWAKCDLVTSVRAERLDRFKIDRGNYQMGHVSMEQVRVIRYRVALSLGLTAEEFLLHNTAVSRSSGL